jgi:ABC-2 type transport system ATP-binding protein
MLIEIRNLRLNLKGRPILRDVSLSLEAGQIYGLLGPNGAGKSTTLSVATGLRRADSGVVRVLTLDPATDTLNLHRRIGVLTEDAGFYDWMTAVEYLGWMAKLHGIARNGSEIAQLLERVGLDAGNDAVVGTYSRGMRQRLSLARTLIHRPELLILDEPTNGLDPRGRREIHDILLNLSANHGVGILLCTHLLDDVERLCTKVGILVHGKTVLEGLIGDILSNREATVRYRLRAGAYDASRPLPKQIRLVACSGEWWHLEIVGCHDPASIWRRLFEEGRRIEEIQRESGGLEDLYLAVTESAEISA